MSVQQTPVYRDDCFQKAARYLGINEQSKRILEFLLDFDIDTHNPEHDQLPAGLTKGNVKMQIQGDLKRMAKLYAGGKMQIKKGLIEAFDEDVKVQFGLKAVFSVAMKLLQVAKGTYVEKNEKFIKDNYICGSIAGMHTPKDADISFGLYNEAAKKCFYKTEYIFRCFLQTIQGFRNNQYVQQQVYANVCNQPYPGFENKVSMPLKFDKIIPLNGLLILFDRKVVYMLHNKDLERVEKIVRGIGLSTLYMHTSNILDEQYRHQLVRSHQKYIDILFKAMEQANYSQCQLVCRAADVAYYLYLSKCSSDIDKKSYQDQLDKIKNESLDKILNIDRIMDLTLDLYMHDAIELLQTYRILPQCDFDCYSQAQKQRELYDKQNKITNKPLFAKLLKWHKLLMIKAYYARHQICPGIVKDEEGAPQWQVNYPYIHPDQIDVDQVDVVNFRGAFAYDRHDQDCLDLIKDKAICPLLINDVKTEKDLQKMKQKDKNQLLDYFSRDKIIQIGELRDGFSDLFFDVKCDDKPEAKKPNGRWFMEAHTDVRMVLSEYEKSVAGYGQYLQGYMQGKGTIEKQRMLNYITEYTYENPFIQNVFVSLDIAKFSPRLPLEVHKILDQQWADAFGMEHIKDMHKIYTEGRMHYVKKNIHHIVDKKGNDFEGFSGKKLTFFHLALMHAVNQELKVRNVIKGNTRFAAQIDDGVMRFQVPVDNLDENVEKLRQLIGLFWLGAGVEVSWDKTFVSKTLVNFLSEVYVTNRRIGCGMRAFVKIRNRSDVIVPSILDDMQFLEGTVRGALVAGAQPSVGYFALCYYAVDILNKWRRSDKPWKDKHTIWLFAPVNLGGIGFPNCLSICGSLDSTAYDAGVGNLYSLGAVITNQRQNIEIVLCQDLIELTPLQRVLTPGLKRREDTILRQNRLQGAMRRSLAYWTDMPVLGQLGLSEASDLALQQAEQLGAQEGLPVEAYTLWYQSSILSFLDAVVAKIMTSRTAQAFLPRKTLFRLACANMVQAKNHIARW